MDRQINHQLAAFDRYWWWIVRVAVAGMVVWTVLDRKGIDPNIPLAIMAVIFFLDFVLKFVRWLNRRDDHRLAKRPPDAP
jgi:hypothetical protein